MEEYIRTNRLYSGDEYTAFVKKTLTEKRLVHTASVVNCALQKAKEKNEPVLAFGSLSYLGELKRAIEVMK